MANIRKRKVRLEVTWSNEDPGHYNWRTVVWGFVEDDSEPGGLKQKIAASDFQTISKSVFNNLTGEQIANNVVAAATDALQDMGAGAGEHIIIDELE